jgi:uncharacterized membrane protein YbhN (UPF0104 family)
MRQHDLNSAGPARPSRLWLGIKVALTVGILFVLFSKIDPREVAAQIAAVDRRLFAAAVLLFGIPLMINSLRLRILLRTQGILVPLRVSVGLDFIGLFFNAFLPGATGGDVIRAIGVIRRYPSESARSISIILLDRIIGLLVLLAFGYLSFLGISEFSGPMEWLRAFGIWIPPLLGAAAATALVLMLLPSDRLPDHFQAWMRTRIGTGVSGKLLQLLQELRHHPFAALTVIALAICTYLFVFASAMLAARSLGIPIGFGQTMIVIATMYIAVSLPISVGGHGVREVVLIGVLGALGLVVGQPELAVAFSLLLLLIQMLWSLVGGVLWLTAAEYLLGSRVLSDTENASATIR